MRFSVTRILACQALALSVLLAGCVTAQKKDKLTADDSGTFRFEAPDNYWKGKTTDLIGTLAFPEGTTGKVPAMVIMHGSAGQGYRDSTWAAFFNEHGIASFKVDYYTTRGLRTAGPGGPETPADVYGALKFLAKHPRIDTDRIGVIGFSRGGSITLLAIGYSVRDTGGIKPAAFIGFYPGCARYSPSRSTPDVPILLLVGERDTLSPADACEYVAETGKRYGKNIKTVVLPGAYHGFDDNTSRVVRFGGQSVAMRPSAEATERAHAEVLATLRKAFGADHVR